MVGEIAPGLQTVEEHGNAVVDPMPAACRAGARLHLSYSSSLEKPEAQGALEKQEGIPGVRWRGVRDSNFRQAI
jgi:hypothetical protein